MSHHSSGPDFGFPHGDARLDLTDLYAFPKPGEADKSILIMNVHPSAVVNPPGPTTRGALNDLQFTGDDFFIDKDVCSIVLEMPNSALGPSRVGLWARTMDGAGGVWVQADRGASPAQAVFLVGSERDGYHAGEPVN